MMPTTQAARQAAHVLDLGYSVLRALSVLGCRPGAMVGKTKNKILDEHGAVVFVGTGEQAKAWIRELAEDGGDCRADVTTKR